MYYLDNVIAFYLHIAYRLERTILKKEASILFDLSIRKIREK